MLDHATSSSPAVQAQLDRLWALSSGADILGLERIARLLDRVGNPERDLPPVFHVAGTNGKGSTCAFLRAALETAGQRVHAYTSPHLVRFNERIRLAGELIGDDALAPLLAEVLDAGGDIGASFFEVTTAAAFLAFARTPADACVIEVGLGGRLDATNVIPAPAVCGIAALGIDHQAFLGDTLLAIAGEKAGIAKAGVPLVTMAYPADIAARVTEVAAAVGAPVLAGDRAWTARVKSAVLRYADTSGELTLPLPALTGAHQADNLALAVAMLRHQRAVQVPPVALETAAQTAVWPARMQRLASGPLADLLPPGGELWLDGGHNPDAGAAVAHTLAQIRATASGVPRPAHLVLGMLANKDAAGLLRPIAPLVDSLTGVPVPGHEHHAPAELMALAGTLGIATTGAASDLPTALRSASGRSDPRGVPPIVLILGSLYLAGVALDLNDELPM